MKHRQLLNWFKVCNGHIAVLVTKETLGPTILPLVHDPNQVTLTEADIILLRARVVVDGPHELPLRLLTAAAATFTCSSYWMNLYRVGAKVSW